MKALVNTLLTCSVAILLFSCKKSHNNPTPTPVITGKWSFVSDSLISISGMTRVGVRDTSLIQVLPTDYYNFAADGKLYINEKNSGGLDTLGYQTISDTLMNIYYVKNNAITTDLEGVFTIKNLSANKLTINTIYLGGGLGIIYDRMDFKR